MINGVYDDTMQQRTMATFVKAGETQGISEVVGQACGKAEPFCAFELADSTTTLGAG